MMVLTLQAAMLSLCIAIISLVATSAVIVDTPFGKLRGAELTAPNNQRYLSFTAIPYAKPPVGELRFAKPEPHPPIDGVYDATKNAPFCLNKMNLHMPGPPPAKEDCLVLNVFVKQLPSTGPEEAASQTSTSTSQYASSSSSSSKKKVMVWIHGGAFAHGGISYYPAGSFVTTQDVIVVAINYRLGVLGFLSTGDSAAPGNYGLWDQVMALRWVKDNIAAFGGDPDDITIAGESAGGASVSFLSLSPATRGLFTRGFPMSGAATSMYAISADAVGPTLELARQAGCHPSGGETDGSSKTELALEESHELISCLRKSSFETLAEINAFVIEKPRFAPRVDGDFLPLHPSVLLKDDTYLESVGFFDRTYLVGLVNNEVAFAAETIDGVVAAINGMEDTTEEEKANLVATQETETERYFCGARTGTSSPPSGKLVGKVMSWYNSRYIDGYAQMVSDLWFSVPTFDFLNALARSKTTNTYFFYYNHYPTYMKGKYRGIAHAFDLPYWFDLDLKLLGDILKAGVNGTFNQDDLDLRVMISDLIGQFIKTGNPWNGLREELPGGWPTFDLQGNHYLDLSIKPSVKRHLYKELQDLWFVDFPSWAAADRGDSSP